MEHIRRIILALLLICVAVRSDPAIVLFQSQSLVLDSHVKFLDRMVNKTCSENINLNFSSHSNNFLHSEDFTISNIQLQRVFFDTDNVIKTFAANNKSITIGCSGECVRALFQFSYTYWYWFRTYQGIGHFYAGSDSFNYFFSDLSDKEISVDVQTAFSLKQLSIEGETYKEYLEGLAKEKLSEIGKNFGDVIRKVPDNIISFWRKMSSQLKFPIDTSIPERSFNFTAEQASAGRKYNGAGLTSYFNGVYENYPETSMNKSTYEVNFEEEKGNLQLFVSHHVLSHFVSIINKEGGIKFNVTSINASDVALIVPGFNLTNDVFATVSLLLDLNLIGGTFKGTIFAKIDIYPKNSKDLITCITSKLDYQLELVLNPDQVLKFFLTKFSIMSSKLVFPQVNDYDVDNTNMLVQTYFSNYICQNIPQIFGNIGQFPSKMFSQSQLTIVPYRGFILYGEPKVSRSAPPKSNK